MKKLQGILGFVPFVVFSALLVPLGLQWAAWLSVLAAVVFVLVTVRGGVQIVPTAQGAIVLAIAILSMTGGADVDTILSKYGPGLLSLVLGLFIVATASTMPFTAQVARSSVPASMWHSPLFLHTNQRISTAWGLLTLVLGVSNLASAEIDPVGALLVLRIVLAWGLPLLGCLVASAYTKRVSDEAREAAHARAHQPEQEPVA